MKQYRFIEDPGHAWLEVPLAELLTLGIAGKISRFSYQSADGLLVYLEEDSDLTTFGKAKGWNGPEWPTEWKEVYQDPTFIRSLPNYQPPAPQVEPSEQPGPDRNNDREDEALTLQVGYLFFLAPAFSPSD